MSEALYGTSGFYRSQLPSSHFRTSVGATPLFAQAMAQLVARIDAALASPPELAIVDMGSGDGLLLSSMLPELPPELKSRCHPVAVDIRDRPPELDERVSWRHEPPQNIVGVLIANEWLDNVPCNVLESVDGELRQVLVDPESGNERLGEAVDSTEEQWMNRWWPATSTSHRVEVGVERDAAWRAVLSTISRGVAVAIDYGHTFEERASGRFSGGTLTGYRHGRQLPPTPDGSSDITAHVAIDACAAAGLEAGATDTALLRQRDALSALGMSAAKPGLAAATADPERYVHELSRASQAAELLDPRSLGDLWWLMQGKDVALSGVISPG